MNYPQTILESMMYYPALYASEFEVQLHLFTVLGNGYGWIDGELVSPSEKTKPVERTAESLLGSVINPYVFNLAMENVKAGYPVSFDRSGNPKTFSIYPSVSDYNELVQVDKGLVEPTDSWKYGIWKFSRTLNKYSVKDFRLIQRVRDFGYNKPDHWHKREMDAFKEFKKITKRLEKRYNEIGFNYWMKENSVIIDAMNLRDADRL